MKHGHDGGCSDHTIGDCMVGLAVTMIAPRTRDIVLDYGSACHSSDGSDHTSYFNDWLIGDSLQSTQRGV